MRAGLGCDGSGGAVGAVGGGGVVRGVRLCGFTWSKAIAAGKLSPVPKGQTKSRRLFEKAELAAGCRQNQQAGSLRYACSARFQLRGARKVRRRTCL